jgi:hypothetical protein
MHPRAAAWASLKWPSTHDANSEHTTKWLKATIHARYRPIHAFKLPTRFPDEPVKAMIDFLAAHFASRTLVKQRS